MALFSFRRKTVNTDSANADRKRWSLRNVPSAVYFLVMVFGIIAPLMITLTNIFKEKLQQAKVQSSISQQQYGAAQSQFDAASGNTGSSPVGMLQTKTGLSAPIIDPATLFSVLGVVAVIGTAAFFIVPRIKSALRKRRELKTFKATHAATWEELLGRRDSLITAWSKYETDVALMIDYPIMTDYTDPVVYKVIAAMQQMRQASITTGDTSSAPVEGSALKAAVDEFELAFTAAEKYARRYGQTKLDVREQRKLSTARTALNIILDGQAPAYEVEAAYKSLRSSLKGIIDLPPKAVAELEALSRRELTFTEKEVEFA